MPFSLLQLSRTAIEALAASRIPEGLEDRAEHEAMPPAFVAARAIDLAAAGHPAPWSTTFLIVSDEDSRIVGGCGFKTAPRNGRVEVGYGVAPTARGRGAATEALRLLVCKAFEAGARVDDDNEYVVQWSKRSTA